LLVNEEYPNLLDEGAKKIVSAGGRVPLSTAGIQLEEETLLQAEKMFSAARDAGITNLVVTSGYRSRQEQEELYREAKNKKYVARPGTSEHELGLALDIQVLRSITGIKSKRWLEQHAHKYGFIIRYPKEKTALTGKPYEPWHYRYVGYPHAAVIYESDFCLEEYIAALQPGKYYQVTAAGKKYFLYRVKPQGNHLLVPRGRDYWFSSDGTGHYIVTAEIGVE
ncbi:MAG: M15 family metallopeptidase, partial [Firmicutes bacterium]|nr:M15 family metallopeptidase [Bacillota bacterium]